MIFDSVPVKRQTLLFSATLTESLTRLKELSTSSPFYWEAPSEYVIMYHCHMIITCLVVHCCRVITVEKLEQQYVLMPAKVEEEHYSLLISENVEL